ncbi:hypothetical protein B7494_g5703 [Chlorociboria aeruginascens]|nr:hypothetical protein B7494_g5703 [Chlorociboria aeruginascens]
MNNQIHYKGRPLPNLAKIKAVRADADRQVEQIMVKMKALKKANKIEELRAFIWESLQTSSSPSTNIDDSNLPNLRKLRMVRVAADRRNEEGWARSKAERAAIDAGDLRAFGAKSTAQAPSTTPSILALSKLPSLWINTTASLNSASSEPQSAKSLPEIFQSVKVPSLPAILPQICTDHAEARNSIERRLSVDSLGLPEQNASRHTPPITPSEAEIVATCPAQKEGRLRANNSTEAPPAFVDTLSEKGDADMGSKSSRVATTFTRAEIANSDGTKGIDDGGIQEPSNTLVILKAAGGDTNVAETMQSCNAGHQVQPSSSTIPNGSSEATSATTTNEGEERSLTEREVMEVNDAVHNPSTTILFAKEKRQTEAQMEQNTPEIMQVDSFPQSTTIASFTNEDNITPVSLNENVTQLVDDEADSALFVAPMHAIFHTEDIGVCENPCATIETNSNIGTPASIRKPTPVVPDGLQLITPTPPSTAKTTPVLTRDSSLESGTSSQERIRNTPDVRSQKVGLASTEKRKPGRPRKNDNHMKLNPSPSNKRGRGRPIGSKNKRKCATVGTLALEPTAKKAKVARKSVNSHRKRNSSLTANFPTTGTMPIVVLGDECEE